PGTLNKYLYGNANPANYTDPTGNFSIGGISASLSVRSILGAAQGGSTGYSMVSFVMGDHSEMSSRQIGMGLLMGMLKPKAASKLINLTNKKKPHGNSKKNNKPHHVYRIDDGIFMDIYKYGISGAPLNKNGSSRRANTQANKLNKTAGNIRYISTVMFKNVPGRVAALQLEYALVCAYAKAHNGNNPPGNKRPICK
ncbi:hypothetical protein MNBD_GAMMA03-809, partial [hydrothermal vent metagenome]